MEAVLGNYVPSLFRQRPRVDQWRQTARTQWDEPQLQTLVCFIALWVCWRAFRKIKRSAIPLRGKRAIAGATLAGFKLMMLAVLY